MRHMNYQQIRNLPGDEWARVSDAYRAERYGIEIAVRSIARRLVAEVSYLHWSVRRATVSHGITLEQRAAIDKDNAVAIAAMARAGIRLSSPERWAQYVSDEMRWRAEDAKKEQAA